MTIPQNESIALGFPPLNSSEIPPCGAYPLCTRAQFFQTYQHLYPAFASGETPAYSNIAFQIFSYALETITGKSFQSSVQDGILTPLGLNNTYYTTPYSSLGVIPGSWKDTQWAVQLGDESPYVTPPPKRFHFANETQSWRNVFHSKRPLSSWALNPH